MPKWFVTFIFLAFVACAPITINIQIGPTPTPLPINSSSGSIAASPTSLPVSSPAPFLSPSPTLTPTSTRTPTVGVAVPSTALAQASATAQARTISGFVDGLLKSAKQIFGPADGVLKDDNPNIVIGFEPKLDILNMIIEARLQNPADAATKSWDYGFQFRVGGSPRQAFRLYIKSNNTWRLVYYTGLRRPDQTADTIEIARGTLTNFDLSTNGTNHLRLAVLNNLAYFFVNGQYVATLDVSRKITAGSLAVATNFVSGDYFVGMIVPFKSFIVWSFPPDAEMYPPELREPENQRATATPRISPTPESRPREIENFAAEPTAVPTSAPTAVPGRDDKDKEQKDKPPEKEKPEPPKPPPQN